MAAAERGTTGATRTRRRATEGQRTPSPPGVPACGEPFGDPALATATDLGLDVLERDPCATDRHIEIEVELIQGKADRVTEELEVAAESGDHRLDLAQRVAIGSGEAA
jgi:hypothetical protein